MAGNWPSEDPGVDHELCPRGDTISQDLRVHRHATVDRARRHGKPQYLVQESIEIGECLDNNFVSRRETCSNICGPQIPAQFVLDVGVSGQEFDTPSERIGCGINALFVMIIKND